MPARPLSSGTISFGLVSIPVKLFSSSESSTSISFNMLHDKCHARLKQQYTCTKDGEIVGRDHMVKGYEFAKDQYVVFTEDEIKAMSQEASRAIEISEFIPAAQVDPIYFDGAYYLGPDKGGEKAYRLLAEAMRKTGRSALARWAARGKQYLVLLRAIEGGIVMQQLHYADEVRPVSEVPIGDAEIKETELNLALQLIDQISSESFRPETYEDQVRKSMHEAIQRKIEGKDVVATPEPPRGQIIDLMEALKASLAKSGDSTGKPKAAAKDKAAPAVVERKAVERRPAKRAASAKPDAARRAAEGSDS